MRMAGRISLVMAVAVPMMLAACAKPAASSRAGRLLTIAGEEANLVGSLDQRLTRQLNIADMQIQSGQKGEAIKTLALAAGTLKAQEKDAKLAISDFRKIAGWTSVAQLSKLAGDDKSALDAYLSAVEAINSVSPVTTRAEYVLSLSQVCYQIRGKAEAAALLVKGGEWAREIADVPTRRYALWCFAQSLVRYDELEQARSVMRNEADASWRSDALTAMARIEMKRGESMDYMNFRNAYAGEVVASASLDAPATAQRDAERHVDKLAGFNKSLDYNENFRQTSVQQGRRPE